MMYRYDTGPEDAGERLDRFLHSRLSEFSRGHLRKIIDLGGVHVDARRIRKCGMVLKDGQAIEVHLDGHPLAPYRIEAGQVIFEDRYIIVLNKPAGIVTQPTPARYKGCLYEALQVWLNRDTRFGRKLEIGMVQRLDRDTSGIILFSIHPRAHKEVSRQIRERTATKHYLALVAGQPQPVEGSISSRLGRDRTTGRTVSVDSGGKEAVTRYRTLKTSSALSLLEVELVTGRTHQIRAHLAESGFPLLGDVLYGGMSRFAGRDFPRQCLHSWQLEIVHPVSGEKLCFTAPPPADMWPG